MYEISELDREIRAAGVPLDGVSGARGNVVVTYNASATGALRALGDSIVAGFDWANADLNWQRAAGKGIATSAEPSGRVVRAVALVLLDEVNALRSQLGLTPRTVAQVKQAIAAKIDSGAAD
jgi:hypothetical protein